MFFFNEKSQKNSSYKPRITLVSKLKSQKNYKNKPEKNLKIELSLPKLLFGNNFEELQYKNRFEIFSKLVNVLKEMGITATIEAIANASVSAIHYSKNIPFTDGATPYHFINKIKQTNVKLSLDVNQTDYRNDGHCYKWHCNSYEIVFYDKIKDLEKSKTSEKRALEKENKIQLNLLNNLKKQKKLKKFEVFRMEIRLNKRQKIKQLFKKLNIKADLIFKKLFKPAISKKILLHYLDELENKRPILLDYKTSNEKALLADLIFNNPALGPKKILQIYGLKHALDVMNIGELRQMFSAYNKRSWDRLIADTNKIKLPKVESSFGVIRKHLEKFKPLKKSKYLSKIHTIKL